MQRCLVFKWQKERRKAEDSGWMCFIVPQSGAANKNVFLLTRLTKQKTICQLASNRKNTDNFSVWKKRRGEKKQFKKSLARLHRLLLSPLSGQNNCSNSAWVTPLRSISISNELSATTRSSGGRGDEMTDTQIQQVTALTHVLWFTPLVNY